MAFTVSTLNQPAARPLKLVFFGSPAFSEPSLAALAKGPDQVVLVVAPPDKPAGRGRKPAPPPIKILASALGLEVYQPSSLSGPGVVETVARLEPDLLVVAAYGRLLPPSFLSLGQWPPVNVHPSLLPAHRGPAPGPWAIIKGDRQTGLSIIFLDSGLDSGPILKQAATPIHPLETGGELEERLSRLGAGLLSQTLAELKAGLLAPRLQDHRQATVNRLMTKQDGLIDWTAPAEQVAALIRGVDPWPGAHAFLNGRMIKFFGAIADRPAEPGGVPGQVLGLMEHELAGEALIVAAGEGRVLISGLQPEGKKRLSPKEFVRGYRPGLFARVCERHARPTA